MKKKIVALMMGTLLLLTACGQTGRNSASTMLPVAAVQSAAQAIVPVEDKAQGDAESPPAGEDTEEITPTGGEETPKPANDVEIPSSETAETPPTPAGEEQSDVPEQPTVSEQPTTNIRLLLFYRTICMPSKNRQCQLLLKIASQVETQFPPQTYHLPQVRRWP